MVDDDKKTRRRRLRHLVAASERTLGDLSYTMDDGMGELVRLAEEYAYLSLSGCFLGPLEKAIRVLDEHCRRSMEEQGVSRDQLEKMRGSVEMVKRRLDLFREKGVATKAKEAWGRSSVAI